MSPRNFDKVSKTPIPKEVMDKIEDETVWGAFTFVMGWKPAPISGLYAKEIFDNTPNGDISTTRDKSTYN
jgi:hypothetical protein